MKKKYSLFIGRYQPLHKGHITLIRKVLDEGKNVCIALRDTPIQESDPYSVAERIVMVEKVFKKEIADGSVVVMGIPDIEEVCYGRRVGWGIRELQLDKETEKISATAIRESVNKEDRGSGI